MDSDLQDYPGLDINDDEAALQYAIELSLLEENHLVVSEPISETPPNQNTVMTSATTLQSLDRRMMEEERLRRLAQRKRSATEISTIPPTKKICLEELSVRTPNKALDKALHFPKGAVKKTWALGFERNQDDIKIEEVLQRSDLKLAILSSFQWDEEWLLSKVDMARTNIILVAYAQDDAQRQSMRANVPANIKFCFPHMHGPGAMHSKLQLLKFSNHLRLVVSTANLVPYDWGETGVMENMLFLIDLPRLDDASKHQPTGFSDDLGRFLKAMGLSDGLVTSLRNYDFSETARLGFVYTIPGNFSDPMRHDIGLCGLGKTITGLGLATDNIIEVDLVCASMGSLKWDLIRAMYDACQGSTAMPDYVTQSAPASRGKDKLPPADIKDRFRIYFPSTDTVCRSKGGRAAGGTICVQSRWWHASSFPRELVRNCISTRTGLLMHSKLILVRRSTYADVDFRGTPAWAYVGSANLSESAWGRLSKDRATKKTKLNCRNWECGVIVQMPASVFVPTPGSSDVDMAVFENTVPVPMKVDGVEYRSTEEPWFFQEQ